MNKIIGYVWIGILILFLSTSSLRADTNQSEPFEPGEKITYAITKVGIKTGEATLLYNGPEKIDGTDAILITFTARAFNFFDEEKIYVDPVSFHPILVKRDLNIWGKKEKITEKYDSAKGMIQITKAASGKTTQQTIEKSGELDNIYSFIYRYRRSGKFKIGDSIAINLPTKDLKIKLQRMIYTKVANQVFDAYYMKSEPPKYQVWFDSGPKKIPLRINGGLGFGDMSMVMTDYKG